MATLTWKNVTGDRLDTGAEELQNAGSLFSKAFENFSGAVEGRQKRETKANTENILNQVRSAGTVEDVDALEGSLGDLNAMKEAAGGNLDTTAISKALAAKRPDLISKARAEETFQRSEAAFRRGETERVKQKAIGQVGTGVFSQQQAAEDANRAAYEKYSAGTDYVNIENNVPVFTDIDAQNLSPQEYSEAARQQQAFRENIAGDPSVSPVSSAKEATADLTKRLIGLGASTEQIANNTAAFKALDKERTSLSEAGQLLVAQESEDLNRTLGQAEVEEKALLDRTLRNNPITHTLNAQGDAIKFEDVIDVARQSYPDDEWIGQGGTELTGLMAKLKTHGISTNGVIGTSGNKGLTVEPWMILEGIKLFGQTEGDAIFNPTVDTKDLLRHISLLAKDPKYKQYATNNRNATIKYNKQMAKYTNDKVNGLRKIAADQSKAEGKVNRAESADFLRDAIAKYRK